MFAHYTCSMNAIHVELKSVGSTLWNSSIVIVEVRIEIGSALCVQSMFILALLRLSLSEDNVLGLRRLYRV